LDKEIQQQCEGCERRTISRRVVFLIPSIVPIKQHICSECERGLAEIGIVTLRIQQEGSLNGEKVRIRKADRS
jgi:hypothetical protein